MVSENVDRRLQLETLLNQAWREHRGEVSSRVETLKAALAAGRAGNLDESGRAEANSVAHKLAGVLGTFGIREGGRAALEIEAMLVEGVERNADWAAEFESRLGVILEGMRKRDAQAV